LEKFRKKVKKNWSHELKRASTTTNNEIRQGESRTENHSHSRR